MLKRREMLLLLLWQVCGGILTRNTSPRVSVTRAVASGASRQRKFSVEKALKIAEAFEAASRERRTIAHTQRVIDRLHEELSGHKIVRECLRSFVASWLASKKPEVSERTLQFYTDSSAKLINFLGERADAPISDITKRDLVSYRNQLSSRLTPRTTNHDLKCARMVFLAARRDGLNSENPAEFVEGVRDRQDNQERASAFTLDELRAVLSVADPERRSMILFGLYSGQRLSDIATLRWQNIDLAKGELRLQTRKTGRRMIIPLAPPLISHLETLPGADSLEAPLHPRAFAILHAQGRSGSLSNQFALLLTQAGLGSPASHRGTGKGRSSLRHPNALSFHGLRRTATTLLHEAGVPAAVCQALIGHDSEALHELYLAVGREASARAAATLHAPSSGRRERARKSGGTLPRILFGYGHATGATLRALKLADELRALGQAEDNFGQPRRFAAAEGALPFEQVYEPEAARIIEAWHTRERLAREKGDAASFRDVARALEYLRQEKHLPKLDAESPERDVKRLTAWFAFKMLQAGGRLPDRRELIQTVETHLANYQFYKSPLSSSPPNSDSAQASKTQLAIAKQRRTEGTRNWRRILRELWLEDLFPAAPGRPAKQKKTDNAN